MQAIAVILAELVLQLAMILSAAKLFAVLMHSAANRSGMLSVPLQQLLSAFFVKVLANVIVRLSRLMKAKIAELTTMVVATQTHLHLPLPILAKPSAEMLGQMVVPEIQIGILCLYLKADGSPVRCLLNSAE
jgi:hypothetical protein